MGRKRSDMIFYKRRKKLNMPLVKEIASWVIEIAIVIVIAFVAVSFFGLRTSVVGSAMENTLKSDDQILVNKFIYIVSHPKAGDIVVFLPNGNEKSHYYVRRVVACPGDEVQIKGGAVYVNGEVIEERTNVAAIEEPGIAEDPIKLGEDEYFVLGDNRNNSEDSRYANIGNVKASYIVGKAWYRFSSISDMSIVK